MAIALATDHGLLIYDTRGSLVASAAGVATLNLGYSPDGSVIVADTLNSGDASVLNAATGEVVRIIPIDDIFPPGEILFTPSGDTLLMEFPVFPLDIPYMWIRRWNVADWSPRPSLESDLAGLPNHIELSRDGSILATSSFQDLQVHFWSYPDLTVLASFPGYSVAYAPSGNIAAVAEDRAVTILNTEGWGTSLTLRSSPVDREVDRLMLAFSLNDDVLVVGGRYLDIFDPSSGDLVRREGPFEEPVESALFSPDGHTLLLVTGNALSPFELSLWEPSN
jgi:WD40 repeat protein